MGPGDLQLDSGEEQRQLHDATGQRGDRADVTIGHGRSPGANGVSVALSAASRCSDRLGAGGVRRGLAGRRLGAGAARACGYAAPTPSPRVPGRARSSRAACSGSSASVSARTTATGSRPRREPRPTFAARSRRSQRTAPPRAPRRITRAEPHRRPSGLGRASREPGRRRCSRPASAAASICAGACVERPTSRSGPTSPRATATAGHPGRHGRRRRRPSTQVRAVVEDQQRAVGRARALEARGGSDDLVVGRVLHPQLDEIDSAPKRGVQKLVDCASQTRYSRAERRRSRRESVTSSVWQQRG